MIKLFLCLSALFVSLVGGGDKTTYTAPHNEFTMTVNKNYTVQMVNKDDGGYEAYLFFNDAADTNTKLYVISVVKVPLPSDEPITQESLSDTSFTNSFLASCGCNLVKQTTAKYSHVTAMQMEVTMNQNTQRAYSLNILHNGALYSLGFVGSQDNFTKYKGDFKSVMDSFTFTK